MKTCKTCLETKELAFFAVHKQCKGGYENTCKACKVVKASKWQIVNKERKNSNNAKWRIENPDVSRQSSRNWNKNNKGHRNSMTRARQAAKLQRTPVWLTEFDLLKMRCLYQVAAMRTRESGRAWHVDHIVPLRGKTVSGLHVPSNLQVIEAALNCSKSNYYEEDDWEPLDSVSGF
jgi:hypothetical protein